MHGVHVWLIRVNGVYVWYKMYGQVCKGTILYKFYNMIPNLFKEIKNRSRIQQKYLQLK